MRTIELGLPSRRFLRMRMLRLSNEADDVEQDRERVM
jgi:hypothetical protein